MTKRSLLADLRPDKQKKKAEDERLVAKAIDRKRFRQEHEAINKILDAIEPLEPVSRRRVLRSAAHFMGEDGIPF